MKQEMEIQGLTETEQTDLNEFLGSRMETPELLNLVQSQSKQTGILFRGLRYRKENIKEGHLYIHWEKLSSWSKDRKIAEKFAIDDYVPEGAIEELYEDRYGEYKDYTSIENDIYAQLEQEFCHILLIGKGNSGFDVNKHYPKHRFSHEQEVIVYKGRWVFESIKKATLNTGKQIFVITAKNEKK